MQTRYYPIQSITTVEYRSGDAWTEKTDGPGDDFYASPEDLRQGIIRIRNEPTGDYQALRVSYTYGEPTTRGIVKRLCALKAGRDALMGTQSPQKAGVLSERIRIMDEDVKRIQNQLGGKLRPWHSADRALDNPRLSDLARRYR